MQYNILPYLVTIQTKLNGLTNRGPKWLQTIGSNGSWVNFSDSTQEAWQIFLEFQIVDLLKPICWCMEMEMETCDNLTVPGFFLADDVGGGGNDDDAP